MMPTPTIEQSTRRRLSGLSGLTDLGRLVAITCALRDRWAELTPGQRAEALELLELLAAVYRRPRVAVPLVGRIAS